MRTTLDLDDQVLQVARNLADERKQSLGRVVSDLALLALQPGQPAALSAGAIPVLPRKPNAKPVTSQSVKDLLEFEL